MILYYAAGGGLGHLTRARALIHTLGITAPWSLLTASRFARDRRVGGEGNVVAIPPDLAGDPAGYRRWLAAMIEGLSPEAIYLDTFPAGILGEFDGFRFPRGVPLHHVARLLRWEVYMPLLRGPLPAFETSYIVEPLTPAHQRAIASASARMLPIELIDPPAEPPLPSPILESRSSSPLWLVVHSEPAGEIEELVAYAVERAAAEGCTPRIVLLSPSRPSSLPAAIGHCDIYPATPLFPHADLIITGCGFNAMRQTLPYREKHRFLPFPRRYDDQFLRAARRRAM